MKVAGASWLGIKANTGVATATDTVVPGGIGLPPDPLPDPPLPPDGGLHPEPVLDPVVVEVIVDDAAAAAHCDMPASP
eukprot:8642586-Ditylum_brightwellii.AAC.1